MDTPNSTPTMIRVRKHKVIKINSAPNPFNIGNSSNILGNSSNRGQTSYIETSQFNAEEPLERNI